MFSFYGSKKTLSALYDAPKFDTLIEPFAGSAGYALSGDNWQRDVFLYDCNPKVVTVWRYLLAASPKDIRSLPNIRYGQRLTNFDLSDGERFLIGYHVNPASARPKIQATKRTCWNERKFWIAENLHKIKHWQVFQQSYEDVPNQKATWFVDPPYQFAGKWYNGFQNMDFKKLAAWCRSRQGQTIVCENKGANWLPFRFLTRHQGMVQTNTEVVWTSR